MRIKEKLQHIIKNSLFEIDITKKTSEIIIEPSKDKNNGDYYTNIAISLTKELHKKPEEIAEIIKEKITDKIIKKLDIVYPGTIIIFLNKNEIINGIGEIIEKNINYGKSNIGLSRKINIDFINKNFTKRLTPDEIYNAIYSDNISRILKFNGFDIEKEFYYDDTTKEIEKQANISKERYINLCNSKINISDSYEYNNNVRDTANDIYSLYKDRKKYEDTEYFIKEEISALLENRKRELDKYRINYNIYTNEKYLSDKGIIDSILDKLNKKGYTYFNKDELWLKTTDFNDKKDRLLIESDGTYNDILSQIAYYKDKLNKKYDGIISVYNKEQSEMKQPIKPILKMLEENTNKIEIKLLPEIVIKKEDQIIEDLNEITNINTNMIRYIFSSQNNNENICINLDKEEYNKFNYIESTNIQIHELLSNYKKKITKVNNYSTIDSEKAYSIVNKLYEFEEIIIKSGLKQMPNLICDYLYELTQIFNEYYKTEEIITENEIYTNERLNLLLSIKIVINNGLDLIGIIPREEK